MKQHQIVSILQKYIFKLEPDFHENPKVILKKLFLIEVFLWPAERNFSFLFCIRRNLSDKLKFSSSVNFFRKHFLLFFCLEKNKWKYVGRVWITFDKKKEKTKKIRKFIFEEKKPRGLLWQKPPLGFLCHRSEGNIWTCRKKKYFLTFFRHCSIIIIIISWTQDKRRRRKKIRISFTEETEGWGSSFASHAKYSITHTYSTTTCERNTYRRTKAGEREKSFNDYDHHSCNLDSNIRELCSSKRKCERIQSKISFSWYFKPEISLN